MQTIKENLTEVKNRIVKAAEDCGRNSADIKLIAVSKTKPTEDLKEAYAAGQRIFGENYVQEYREKTEELSNLDIDWHFIGHLQRNKVKYLVSTVGTIHSLNSIKLAEEIEKRSERKIDCLIEVNLADEDTKTGIHAGNIEELVKKITEMKRIRLTGLMTMPPFSDTPEDSRPYFKELKELLNSINNSKIYPSELYELSMGMTGDLEVAIQEGATMVRIGTAIFGSRNYGSN